MESKSRSATICFDQQPSFASTVKWQIDSRYGWVCFTFVRNCIRFHFFGLRRVLVGNVKTAPTRISQLEYNIFCPALQLVPVIWHFELCCERQQTPFKIQILWYIVFTSSCPLLSQLVVLFIYYSFTKNYIWCLFLFINVFFPRFLLISCFCLLEL